VFVRKAVILANSILMVSKHLPDSDTLTAKNLKEAWRAFKLPSENSESGRDAIGFQGRASPPRNDNHTHWRLFSCCNAKADDYITKAEHIDSLSQSLKPRSRVR